MRSFPHSWPVCNVTIVTQRVLLVGAGTVYLSLYPSSPRVYSVINTQCLQNIVYPLVLFPMTTVLWVLRSTASIYPFYMFKLFLHTYVVRRKMSMIMSRMRRMGIISFSPFNHIHFFLGWDHANHHPHPLKMVTRHRHRFHQIFQNWAINKVIILEISVTPMHLGIFLCYNKVREATKFGDRIFFLIAFIYNDDFIHMTIWCFREWNFPKVKKTTWFIYITILMWVIVDVKKTFEIQYALIYSYRTFNFLNNGNSGGLNGA